ncbi:MULTISPECIES: hypothetical protein [Bradyrhizobium]|uniref:Uncharacterized protein n=1 Tax=Bradyrhizobium yuanmingense TaxID=108015 RepID=A0A1C3UD25_9BRAD|nr:MULTISPECIES: hypothetical protein [Bradyrhizobium]MCA1379835.1 hypothetical protein [Bradyrhizobium sp. BRP05]MCA1420151.1 hypothetical protein [Bradyrhizobium sp. BRP23]TWI20832.1 hypothetical protein IQ15_06174 [Bradyrhizobium yuanmingense]SCB13390.1 hypothetical protein GA0061099_1001971 [Bradyrhizobium yuanmingense]
MTFGPDRPLPADFSVTPIAEPRRHGRGNPPTKTKGAVAKITRDLKNGILDGAISCGSDGKGAGGLKGYLAMCARKHPKSYLNLLGKLVPHVIEGSIGPALVAQINIQAIPSGQYVTDKTLQLDAEPVEASVREAAHEAVKSPASDQ